MPNYIDGKSTITGDEVHCLDCDNVYPEENPTVEVCPVCGNTDRMRTVYLQQDDSDLERE